MSTDNDRTTIRYVTHVAILVVSNDRPTSEQLAGLAEAVDHARGHITDGTVDLGWVHEIETTYPQLSGHRWIGEASTPTAPSSVMLPPSHVMPSEAVQAIKVAVDASGPLRRATKTDPPAWWTT